MIIIITLVVAGIGRLLSIILLAMVGIFPPKKDHTPIVHLPPQHPAHVLIPWLPTIPRLPPPRSLLWCPHLHLLQFPSPPQMPPVTVPAAAAAPKRDLMGDVRRRLSGASSALKEGAWKAKVDPPRNLPKPAEVKSAVEHQAAHHPIVVAAAKEPPVLAKDWADAVAEADERAAARAKAQQPPAIKVTVRDLDDPHAVAQWQNSDSQASGLPAQEAGQRLRAAW